MSKKLAQVHCEGEIEAQRSVHCSCVYINSTENSIILLLLY